MTNSDFTLGRRGLLKLGAGAGIAALWGTAACGNDSTQAGTGGTEQIKLRFCWWGADARAKLTQQAIEQYQKENPHVTISGEPADSTAYWDKLATQVAGNGAPDIIQMEEKYIRDYASRGALMDLAKYPVIKTDRFAPGTLEPGQFADGLWGVNGGVTVPMILVNPDLFKQAGVDLPDDKTWTWDDYAAIAAQITANSPKGIYGASSGFWNDHVVKMWIAQRGKPLFTEHGLGFEAEDISTWWDFNLQMIKDKGLPDPDAISEDDGKAIDQNSFSTNKSAMASIYTSNQANSFEKASGADLKLLRFPSMTGKPKDAKMYYKVSQYFSGYSKSKYPDEVAKFINYLVNTNAAGEILLTERGVPANLDVREDITPKLSAIDQKAVTFLNDIADDTVPPPITPPVGSGVWPKVCRRYSEDVMFGRTSSAEAAQKFVDEMKSGLS